MIDIRGHFIWMSLDYNSRNRGRLECRRHQCSCSQCDSSMNENSTEPLIHPELMRKRYLNTKLIYVVGIPERAASYDLASSRFFGRFGQITDLTVNKKAYKDQHGRKTVTAHILYANSKDALLCLHCTNISTFHKCRMTASIGTTQYCMYFLRGVPCQNAACSFQHSEGEPMFQFSPDEMNKNNIIFTTLTRPAPPQMVKFVPCDFAGDCIPSQPDIPDDLPFESNPLSKKTRKVRKVKRIHKRMMDPQPESDPQEMPEHLPEPLPESDRHQMPGFLPGSVLQEISEPPLQESVRWDECVYGFEPSSRDPVVAYFEWVRERDAERERIRQEEERAAWERLYAERSQQTLHNPTPKRSLYDHGINIEFPNGHRPRSPI